MSFVVALGSFVELVLKPLPLIARVVELGKTVDHFEAADNKLETPDFLPAFVSQLGQRRYFRGVINHKSRLHKMRTANFLIYFIGNFTFRFVWSDINAELFGL